MRASGWLAIAAASLVWIVWNASGRAQGDDVQGQLSFDGRVRSYVLHRPPQASGGRPIPLVMLLHGGGQNASGMERMSGMNAIADKEGFLSSTRTERPRAGKASRGTPELAVATR